MRGLPSAAMPLDVLYLNPAFPTEMAQFCTSLATAGARVLGVGDTPAQGLPDRVRRALSDYLVVPSLMDEDDALARIVGWLGARRPDRIETNWEPVLGLAARLRERLGVAGLGPSQIGPLRDKEQMKARIAQAGLPVDRPIRVRSAAQAHEAAKQLGYPVILKPVDGAGSADTSRVDDAAGLTAALARLGHLDQALVERFVVGTEHTFEALCAEGRPIFTSVSTYEPNTLTARREGWISPIIFCHRHVDAPALRAGSALGRAAIQALGVQSGFVHMEWFRTEGAPARFGELAARAPGARMVDLINFANDIDLYRAWADVVLSRTPTIRQDRPYAAALVFKRAHGEGRIRTIEGLQSFLARHAGRIAHLELTPIGAPRRDWRSTFLGDGVIAVRDPDEGRCWEVAREAASTIRLIAE